MGCAPSRSWESEAQAAFEIVEAKVAVMEKAVEDLKVAEAWTDGSTAALWEPGTGPKYVAARAALDVDREYARLNVLAADLNTLYDPWSLSKLRPLYDLYGEREYRWFLDAYFTARFEGRLYNVAKEAGQLNAQTVADAQRALDAMAAAMLEARAYVNVL